MLTTDNIFKDFDADDITPASIESENIYAWLEPNQRTVKDRLSEIGLRPYRPRFLQGSPIPQLEPDVTTARYFFKVYDRTSGVQLMDEASYPQFTVTYGHIDGKGSPPGSNLPTQAIYRQYTNSVLAQDETSFGFDRDHFYAVNLNRRTFHQSLRPGHWELTLAFEGTGPMNGVKLVDQSVADGSLAGEEEIEVVEGDIDARTVEDSPVSSRTYGYVYPKKGIIILNPDALGDVAVDVSGQNENLEENIIPELRDPQTVLSESSSREVVTNQDGNYVWEGGFDGDQNAAESEFPDWPYFRNHKNMFDAVDRGESFRAQAIRDRVKVTYTASLEQPEGNYSLNPTYSDDQGNITFPDAPGTYPTAVGLYNDDFELLAVAKISPPERKTNRDAFSVDVTLDF